METNDPSRLLSQTLQFFLLTHQSKITSDQFSSVAQSCPTLCDPMDFSTPCFLAHHQFPELSQTQVHQVGDAIQPSHPLSSSSPLVFNLFLHQGFFKWVSSSHRGGQSIAVLTSASVLPMNIQDWFPLGWTGWISFLSRGLSRVLSKSLFRWFFQWSCVDVKVRV